MLKFKIHDKCRITRSIPLEIDGVLLNLYDDNIGDIVEILDNTTLYKPEDDFGYYDVNNITKHYSQYVPEEILELVEEN